MTSQNEWNQIEAARLLRELALELKAAEGPARNGLFLELHRLHDTLFRRALESHPDAPPALAAQAFSLTDALPAPQVVRELNSLKSSLVTQEIRNLYKHINVARNNMAHESVLERVIVSKANAKRMAHLAELTAHQLDPDGVVDPDSPNAAGRTAPPSTLPGKLLYLTAGLLGGAVLTWAWHAITSDLLLIGIALLILLALASLLLFDPDPS